MSNYPRITPEQAYIMLMLTRRELREEIISLVMDTNTLGLEYDEAGCKEISNTKTLHLWINSGTEGTSVIDDSRFFEVVRFWEAVSQYGLTEEEPERIWETIIVTETRSKSLRVMREYPAGVAPCEHGRFWGECEQCQ